MLPLLHVAPGATCVLCAGPFAEALATDALRWRDVVRVLVTERPQSLRDRRVEVIADLPIGTCQAVLVSPDHDPEPYVASLAKRGVLCASTGYQDRIAKFYQKMRDLFAPSPIVPWREHLPGPIYGVLASPGGKPVRHRQPPESARRINRQYLPALFVFGTDEVPAVLGSAGRRTLPVPVPRALPTPKIQPCPTSHP